jgi:nicotinate-nucleotide adenylyltransferase
VLIIGTDNLQIFEKWKDHDQILKNYEVYVYPRLPDTINELNNHSKVKFIDAPIMEISATFIRKAIREKKDVHYMLPGNIYNFIKEKHLYE